MAPRYLPILDFLHDTLTLAIIAKGRVGYSAARVKNFVGKMQQYTGPVAAKAVEDTAFYRYHRLLALNEVGNDPALSSLHPRARFYRSDEETGAENGRMPMTACDARYQARRGRSCPHRGNFRAC